jgi:hypothetical protein
MTNIVSECRSANIVRDHAMILPDDATSKPDGIFGKDTHRMAATCLTQAYWGDKLALAPFGVKFDLGISDSIDFSTMVMTGGSPGRSNV